MGANIEIEEQKDYGWFQTLEFTHKTALLVLEQKQKKYNAHIEHLPNGKFIVKYKGYTKREKDEIKKEKLLDQYR